MYSYFLKKIDPEKKMERLKVTSIGCGSMIDYWSLTRVIPPKCSIYYRGIDRIQWSYCMPVRARDDVKRRQGDIVELCQNTQELIADVYIFPKSINELSFEDIQKLGESFGNKISDRKLVCLLFSLRTDDGSMHRDMEKTKCIYESMISNGFNSDDESGVYVHLSEKIQGKKYEH